MLCEIAPDLPDHAKTHRLRSLLHRPLPTILGHLVLFWTSALREWPSGDLTDVDPPALAAAAGWEGDTQVWLQAMLRAGFLEVAPGDRLVIHDWLHHTGRQQRAREANAARQRAWRARNPGAPRPWRQGYRRGLDLLHDPEGVGITPPEAVEKVVDNVVDNYQTGFFGETVHSNDPPSTTSPTPQETNPSGVPVTPANRRREKTTTPRDTDLTPIPDTDVSVNFVNLTPVAAPPGEPEGFGAWFDTWWALYPARYSTPGGAPKKLDKAKTRATLLKWSARKRDRLLAATKHYRDSGATPRDPLRFLRDDWWTNWEEALIPLEAGKAHRNGGPPLLFGADGKLLAPDKVAPVPIRPGAVKVRDTGIEALDYD